MWLKIEDSVLEIINGVIIIRKFERVTVYSCGKVSCKAHHLLNESVRRHLQT